MKTSKHTFHVDNPCSFDILKLYNDIFNVIDENEGKQMTVDVVITLTDDEKKHN